LPQSVSQRVVYRRSSITASPMINAGMSGAVVKLGADPSMKGSYSRQL
jgi:hypothetical protein